MNPKTSIIIVDYMKAERVARNVESLLRQKTDFPFEIIIVDNSGNHENAIILKNLEKHQGVRVIINPENTGYVLGNNLGVSRSIGEYVLIVNPDIILRDTDALAKLIAFMDRNKSVGICGPKHVIENSNANSMTARSFPKIGVQISRRTFLRKLPFIKQRVSIDEMRHMDPDKIQQVDWLHSSFWITRRTLWDRLGGLSEDYFLFMSDTEFCFKCWEAGFEVVYLPAVTVFEDGLRCSDGGVGSYFKKWTLRQHLKDSITFQWKHIGSDNPRIYLHNFYSKPGTSRPD